jgi:GxxExxY protein
MSKLHVSSPLSAEDEDLVTRTIGAALTVHRELGPGFWESIYHRALCLQLQALDIAFDIELPVSLSYRGESIGIHRLDMVVAKRIVVELKAVPKLTYAHQMQVLAYLRASGLRIGLLFNFHEPILAVRRVIL